MASIKTFHLSPADARLVVQAFAQKDIHSLGELDAQWMAHLGAGIYAVEKGGVLYLAKITHLSDGVTVDCQVGSFTHYFIPAAFKHNSNSEAHLSTTNAKLVTEAFHKRGFSQISFLDTQHMLLIKSTACADIYVTEKLGIVYVAHITRRSSGSIECQVAFFFDNFQPAPFRYSR